MRTRLIPWAVAVVAGLAAAGCTSSSGSGAGTTSAAPAPNESRCPLTGEPAPGGGPVPARPALAVKVDNYPGARPQSGLDDADIVFEEPVEGGITRYVAVFQCRQAALVGPIRSARNIDIGILGQFGRPVLAHVGGIEPVLQDIAESPLVDLDLGAHPSVVEHPPGRVAPYDTYASTEALWDLEAGDRTPPPAVFRYAASPPTGPAATTVAIPFSTSSDVVWRFDAGSDVYLLDQGTVPDLLADGTPISAANVVVQFVHVTLGPWAENSEGGLEVQANLYRQASGPVEVFRNGREVVGTWSRNGLAQPTALVTSGGATIALAPGRTWVELVPTTVGVSVS